MCISNVISQTELKVWKKKQPQVIIMWKVLTKDLYSPYSGYPYKYGWNIAPKSIFADINRRGFHVFLTRKSARNYNNYVDCVRKVLVNKRDVIAIGCTSAMMGLLKTAIVRKLKLLKPTEGR